MTDEAAFRTAIAASPTDATTRLVFADWLDEHARPRDAALQRVLAQPASDEMRLAFAAVCEREADQLVARATAIGPRGELLVPKAGKFHSATGPRDRAEFIRVQVELAESKPYAYWQEQARTAGAPSLDAIVPHVKIMGPDADEKARVRRELVHLAKLEQRERELLKSDAIRDALTPHRMTTAIYQPGDLFNPVGWYCGYGNLETFHATIERGFAHAIACRASGWLRCGDAIREAHPVEKLTLTTRPELKTWRSQTPPFRMRIQLPGRKSVIEVTERELVLARTPESGIETILATAAERLLAWEFPGLAIELPRPATLDDVNAIATAGGLPPIVAYP